MHRPDERTEFLENSEKFLLKEVENLKHEIRIMGEKIKRIEYLETVNTGLRAEIDQLERNSKLLREIINQNEERWKKDRKIILQGELNLLCE
jgi:hypothetical protein